LLQQQQQQQQQHPWHQAFQEMPSDQSLLHYQQHLLLLQQQQQQQPSAMPLPSLPSPAAALPAAAAAAAGPAAAPTYLTGFEAGVLQGLAFMQRQQQLLAGLQADALQGRGPLGPSPAAAVGSTAGGQGAATSVGELV
jgi:hypothetical protein